MSIATDDPQSPDVPEHQTVPARLERLAAQYAADGDVRRAQLATWAADVYVLEELLWENGLAESPDPVAQLAAVGESVASALETLADGVSGEVQPREVIEAARRAMVSTFDESVHEVLLGQLASLDHLDACMPSADRIDDDPAGPRLGGRTGEALVADLREAAADCLHISEVMEVEGEQTAASRMSHQADVATYEAYLVAAALHGGDAQLATVDLRWDLARGLAPTGPDSVGPDQSPFATLRRELISLVGSAEMETLWRAFESADGS